MYQQHSKKLVLINIKLTVTKTSSSHRGIFTKDYAKEHLPLDRGIHQFMLKSIFLLAEGFSNMPSSEALQSVSYIHLAHTRCSVLPFVFSTKQLQIFHAVVFSTLSHSKQSHNKLHSNLHCCASHYSRSIFLHASACSPLLSISFTLLCLHIYSALGVITVHQPLQLSDKVSAAICCS